jgi:hypothetical protein
MVDLDTGGDPKNLAVTLLKFRLLLRSLDRRVAHCHQVWLITTWNVHYAPCWVKQHLKKFTSSSLLVEAVRRVPIVPVK